MRLLTLLTLITLLAVGCTPETYAPTSKSPPITEEPVQQPTITSEVVTETPTLVLATDTLTPTVETIVDTPTPSTSVCVFPSAHAPLEETFYEDYPHAILDFINAGATPGELAEVLISREMTLYEQQLPVISADLNADGLDDFIVTIVNPEVYPQGHLLIYNCEEGSFILAHIEPSDTAVYAPQVIRILDMNADGQNELIISKSSRGAHTSFADIQILSWTGSFFESKLQGSTKDLPSPEANLTNYNQDEIYELEVVGHGVQSVGAGPPRDIIRLWEYDRDTGYWVLASEILAASNWRIHALHDADAAMRRGEYLIASLLYQQVMEDESLLDWMDHLLERANLSAYAYFKRVVATAFQGDLDGATTLYGQMSLELEDTSQYIFVEMTLSFLEGFAVDGQEGGCVAAHEFAALNEEAILMPLGSAVYGYSNPDYAPEDICP